MHTLKEARLTRAMVISILLLFSVFACRMQLRAQTTNGVIIVLGPHYTLDAAGVNQAISDAETAGGGLVIVATPISFGSTTITVGSVCNSDCTTGAVELWFAGTGVWSTSASPGFVVNSRSKIIAISSRETELDETNSANDIITCTQNGSQTCENGEIGNIRLEGGKRALEFTGDTPGWHLHDIFFEGQTCTAGDAQAHFDDHGGLNVDERLFFNDPAACNGINVGPAAAGNNNGVINASFRDIFCQNGVWCVNLTARDGLAPVGMAVLSNIYGSNMVQGAISLSSNSGSSSGPVYIEGGDCENCNTGGGNHSSFYVNAVYGVSLVSSKSSGSTQYDADFGGCSGGCLIENFDAAKIKVDSAVTVVDTPAAITGTPNASWPSVIGFSTAYFQGSTSGAATIQAPAVAGTPSLTLPAVTGTLGLNVQNTAIEQQ